MVKAIDFYSHFLNKVNNASNFEYVNASISVKVELIQLVTKSNLLALRFSRTEEIFGTKELVSVKNIIVSNEEVYNLRLETLTVAAFATNSRMYATMLLNDTQENINNQYYKLMEIRELLQALKNYPASRLDRLEITK